MNSRFLTTMTLICLSILVIQCGNNKSKAVQTTEQKKVQAPKKDVFIIKKDAVRDIKTIEFWKEDYLVIYPDKIPSVNK